MLWEQAKDDCVSVYLLIVGIFSGETVVIGGARGGGLFPCIQCRSVIWTWSETLDVTRIISIEVLLGGFTWSSPFASSVAETSEDPTKTMSAVFFSTAVDHVSVYMSAFLCCCVQTTQRDPFWLCVYIRWLGGPFGGGGSLWLWSHRFSYIVLFIFEMCITTNNKIME